MRTQLKNYLIIIKSNYYIMKNVLIYILMFIWIRIIYYNLFIKTTIELFTFLGNDNKTYATIDALNLLDKNLLLIILNNLYNIDYFSDNNYIGITNYNIKDMLIIIPFDSVKYITDNKMIGLYQKDIKYIPIEMIIQNNNNIKKKIIKNSTIDLYNLNSIYLENIYNYQINNMNIPIYLLSNAKNDIKVILNKKLY